ncbi:hypothetical protein ACVWZP_000587 [Pseudomonas sp. TE36184]
MNTTPRIALIGECMIELQHRADGSLHQSFGGHPERRGVPAPRVGGARPRRLRHRPGR